jgi:hypothetical protein
MKKSCTFLFFLSFLYVYVNGQVEIYQYPSEAMKAPDFKVYVNDQEVFVHDTPASTSQHPLDLQGVPTPAFASFGCSETVTVRVELIGESLNSVEVRPGSKGISPTISGSEFSFTMTCIDKIIVLKNGDKDRRLYLFANPLELNKPSPSDPNVIYYAAGQIYDVDVLSTQSGQIVYIEGGAIVKGNLNVYNDSDVQVKGYGILDATGRDPNQTVRVKNSPNFTMEGITILNENNWTVGIYISDNVKIEDVKIIAYNNVYTDGIDVLGSSHIHINNCFITSGDDCISLKTDKWIFAGNVEDVVVENCILWKERRGNAMTVGREIGRYEGNSHLGIRDVYFNNIDVAYDGTVPGQPFSRAAISVYNDGMGYVKNINWTNINIDEAKENLINISSAASAEASVDSITVTNVNLTGGDKVPSIISGYDSQNKIGHVEFDSLMIHGQLILHHAAGNFTIRNADEVIFGPISNFSANPKHGFSMYPNPASSFIKLNTHQSNGILEIWNLQGQLIKSKQVEDNSYIEINDISNGCYIAVFKSKTRKTTVRKIFITQR